MATGATRQVLNIGLDAPKNPTIRRRWDRHVSVPSVTIQRVRRALYRLGYISADLERHGSTVVVKLETPLEDIWVHWLCHLTFQDCIAVVTKYHSPPWPHWHGKLVGPATSEYEPFKPAEFIGLPEDF